MASATFVIRSASRPLASVSSRCYTAVFARQQCRRIYGYAQSKSLVYTNHGDPGSVLALHSHSISPPHSHLLTLRTLAAPLNPADVNQIQGVYPALPEFTHDLGTKEAAAVPGNEMVARVVSVGADVRDLKAGDLVVPARAGLGTWRTHMQVLDSDVVRVAGADDSDTPSILDLSMCTVNPVTAYRLLTDFIDLNSGDWVIQNGANSAVGRCVIQLAALRGIKTINVVRARAEPAMSKLKADLTKLGADVVVTDEQLADSKFMRPLIERLPGAAPKLGFNCVHGKAGLALLKNVAAGGTFVTYGAMAKAPLPLPAGLLIFRDLRVRGFWLTNWARQHTAEKRAAILDVVRLIREHKLTLASDDSAVDSTTWGWKTDADVLVNAVGRTLDGMRSGKGVFVFDDTTNN